MTLRGENERPTRPRPEIIPPSQEPEYCDLLPKGPKKVGINLIQQRYAEGTIRLELLIDGVPMSDLWVINEEIMNLFDKYNMIDKHGNLKE